MNYRILRKFQLKDDLYILGTVFFSGGQELKREIVLYLITLKTYKTFSELRI